MKKIILLLLIIALSLQFFACKSEVSKVKKEDFKAYQDTVSEMKYDLLMSSLDADELIFTVYYGEKTLDEIEDDINAIIKKLWDDAKNLDDIELSEDLLRLKTILKDKVQSRSAALSIAAANDNMVSLYSSKYAQNQGNAEHDEMENAFKDFEYELKIYHDMNY